MDSMRWLWHNFVVICIYSHNGKFSYGYASSLGKRSSMEDFYETRIDGVEGEIVGLFGVFDGIVASFSHLRLLFLYWLENICLFISVIFLICYFSFLKILGC